MNIDKLKELAVPVSKKHIGRCYLCINVMYNNCSEIYYSEVFYSESNFHDNTGYMVTHVIDFDLLTTKARAIELAKDAWDNGFSTGYDILDYPPVINSDKEDFITENQNKL